MICRYRETYRGSLRGPWLLIHNLWGLEAVTMAVLQCMLMLDNVAK